MNQHIKQHLDFFSRPRPTGSRRNEDTSDYIYSQLQSYGYSPQRQWFDCIDWDSKKSLLIVDGKSFNIIAADYSLGCSVNGRIVPIQHVEELRSRDTVGAVLLLYSQTEALSPKNFIFYNLEEHKKLIAALEGSRAKAVITISPDAGQFTPIIEDGDFELPVAVARKEDEAELVHLSGSRAYLLIDAQRHRTRSCNVIAAQPNLPKVCLTTHIDTKPRTPGVLDNGTGLAIILEAARRSAPRQYRFSLEFAFLNGEDYFSTPGQVAYLNSHLSEPGRYELCINVDGAGLKDSGTTFALFGCTQVQQQIIRDTCLSQRDFSEIAPWPQGDHSMFTAAGIPAVALTSQGIFDIIDTVIHTEADNLDLVDVDTAADIADMLCELLDSL
jgi:aminopeptidase YwaD